MRTHRRRPEIFSKEELLLKTQRALLIIRVRFDLGSPLLISPAKDKIAIGIVFFFVPRYNG